MAGLVFLDINRQNFNASEPATAAALEPLAAGDLREIELSRWFQGDCDALIYLSSPEYGHHRTMRTNVI